MNGTIHQIFQKVQYFHSSALENNLHISGSQNQFKCAQLVKMQPWSMSHLVGSYVHISMGEFSGASAIYIIQVLCNFLRKLMVSNKCRFTRASRWTHTTLMNNDPLEKFSALLSLSSVPKSYTLALSFRPNFKFTFKTVWTQSIDKSWPKGECPKCLVTFLHGHSGSQINACAELVSMVTMHLSHQ